MKTKYHLLFVIMTILSLVVCAIAQAKPERVKAEEGDPCDPKTFVESCDGTILLYCEKDVVKAIDCGHLGIDGLAESCVEFEIGAAQASSYAKCMTEEERCYDENATYIRETILGLGKSVKHTFKCEKTTNGDFFYRSSAGDNYEKFHNRSRENSNQKRPVTYLGKHGGESCDKENSLFQFCEMSQDGIAFEIIYQCERSANGDVLHLRRHAQTLCDGGSGSCSADGKCIRSESCDPNNFTAHCNGNETVNCKNGKISQQICVAKLQCTVIDNKAQCIKRDNKSCNNEGEIVSTRCNNNKEFYSECKRAADGNLYYVSAGNKKCSKGCNEDKTACNP